MTKEFKEDLTCHYKPDFTIEELDELTKSAPYVFGVMDLADTICKMAQNATEQTKHTPYMKLWSNLIDLEGAKDSMGLQRPRDQVPMPYFFPSDASERYWRMLEALGGYSKFAAKMWNNDIASTWRISARMLTSTITSVGGK